MNIFPGSKGIPGRPGDMGMPGPRGEEGRMGSRGFPGRKGDTGDEGEKGCKGDIGPPAIAEPPRVSKCTYHALNMYTCSHHAMYARIYIP